MSTEIFTPIRSTDVCCRSWPDKKLTFQSDMYLLLKINRCLRSDDLIRLLSVAVSLWRFPKHDSLQVFVYVSHLSEGNADISLVLFNPKLRRIHLLQSKNINLTKNKKIFHPNQIKSVYSKQKQNY